MNHKEWSDYYRKALETVQLELKAPIKEGENFSMKKAYVLGYIEGALKMIHVESEEKK
jgi:hypothetical protein